MAIMLLQSLWPLLCLDAVEHDSDEVAYALLVVGVGFCLIAVCDNLADRHAAMAHEASKAGERSAFHFIVGNLAAIVFEFFNAAVEVGV